MPKRTSPQDARGLVSVWPSILRRVRQFSAAAGIGALAAFCMLGLGLASADSSTLPIYGGAMTFPQIQESSDPEEYSWEVALGEGQALEAVDEQHVRAYYVEGGHTTLSITAEGAHDASGATVPTSLSVSEGKIITLTVRHRDGNPIAAGAPFDYPVLAGKGWLQVSPGVVVVGPLDEEELRKARERIEQANLAAEVAGMEVTSRRCSVPRLKGRTLRGSRRQLAHSHCGIGRVTVRIGGNARTGKVVRQSPRPGVLAAAGTQVNVVMGR